MINLPRVMHTIHHRVDKRPFTVHMEQKTYLLCFEDRRFAMLIGHILESHYQRLGVWPNTEVSVNQPLLLNYGDDKNFIANTEGKELDQLYVQDWNAGLVNEYVLNNLFHLMVVEGDHTRPSTRCITYSYPDSHVRRIIQNRDLM